MPALFLVPTWRLPMKRRLLKLFVPGLLLSILSPIRAAAEPSQDVVRREMRMLQGVWKIISVERDGKAAPKDEINDGTVFIQGNRLIIQTKDSHQDMDYGLDPAKQPKGIDLRSREGRSRENLVRGIYALERERLKLCVSQGGQERPADFTTAPGADR